jgi:hypothetical protein
MLIAGSGTKKTVAFSKVKQAMVALEKHVKTTLVRNTVAASDLSVSENGFARSYIIMIIRKMLARLQKKSTSDNCSSAKDRLKPS